MRAGCRRTPTAESVPQRCQRLGMSTNSSVDVEGGSLEDVDGLSSLLIAKDIILAVEKADEVLACHHIHTNRRVAANADHELTNALPRVVGYPRHTESPVPTTEGTPGQTDMRGAGLSFEVDKHQSTGGGKTDKNKALYNALQAAQEW
ncbi:unnamed protein product [Acanthoscelides obtectus]|uniref:Uncharacterized protein n=1 Tax=Acanthoscelides obtectus TaxID=200917 RepID=A0A9P0M0J7_ACAOB|nr:unnamed protein product [Acanthoscelides obtectus]CAK1661153.1 hypothetical protein AOBTE_LOCUS22479 [Acanthoscelides obtectus]